MQRYPAIFRKDPGSDYGVEFPDLPGCFSAGATLEEARRMASEALTLHLRGLEEDGERSPRPSSLDEVEQRLLREGRGEGFFGIVEVEPQRSPVRFVRVNISVAADVLAEIDEAARARHMTRSAFLVDAARKHIHDEGAAEG